jgi:glycosyltransferase involved in cell wall biosynthesis
LVGFAGAHGIANSLKYVIDAASKLSKMDVVLILLGTGQEKENLMRYVKGKEINNVYFLDFVNKHTVPTFLKQMDVLFIGLKKASLFRFGISPNKIFDYMMSSRPILQAIDAGNNLIDEANCGLFVEPENADTIAEAMVRFKSMSDEELKTLGNNGYRFVNQNHTYKVLGEKFLEYILATY